MGSRVMRGRSANGRSADGRRLPAGRRRAMGRDDGRSSREQVPYTEKPPVSIRRRFVMSAVDSAWGLGGRQRCGAP